MLENTRNLAQIKLKILKEVYPSGSQVDYIKLSSVISQKQLEIQMSHVLHFNALGFRPFIYQDSIVQDSIRTNKPSHSPKFNSILAVFKALADKINNKQFQLWLDKCILRHYHDYPDDLYSIHLSDVKQLLDLTRLYSGYTPNCRIQTVLLLNEQKNLKSFNLILDRVKHACKLEFDEFPKEFFNTHILNNIFYGDLQNNQVERICHKGLTVLARLYKLLGDEYLQILKDSDVQFKLLVCCGLNHELNMKRCLEVVCEVIDKLVYLNVCLDGKEEKFIDLKILKILISNEEIEFTKSVEYLRQLKALFPEMKLKKRCLWRLFNLRDSDNTCNDEIVQQNIENFLCRVENTTCLYNWIVIEEIILKDTLLDSTPFKFLLELNRIQEVKRKEGNYSEENLSSRFFQSISRSISNIRVPTSFSLVNLAVVSKEVKQLAGQTNSSYSSDSLKVLSFEVIDMPKLDLYTSNLALVETEVSEKHHIIEVKRGGSEIIPGLGQVKWLCGVRKKIVYSTLIGMIAFFSAVLVVLLAASYFVNKN